MNGEFQKRALAPAHAGNEALWADRTDMSGRNESPPKTYAEMVLGFNPSNRHERRKAAKLIRERGL